MTPNDSFTKMKFMRIEMLSKCKLRKIYTAY